MNDSRAFADPQTASDVIDAVGGTAACSRLTGRSMGAVSNWRATGRLAPEFFLIIGAALSEKGLSAAPELWGIRSVPAAQAGAGS